MTDDEPPDHLPPTRPRRRVESHPNGVPVVVIERPSRGNLRVEDDSGAAADPLDARIDERVSHHSARTVRKLWRGLAGVAGVALGALVAAGSAALDERERRGVEREQQRTLVRDLERLRFEIDSLRASVYAAPRWRRDDQPDPPPPKGPTP